MKSSGDVDENKIFAALAYFGPLFLVTLLLKKDSPFALYHAKQGLVLFVLSVAIGFLSSLPIIGWFLIAPIGSLLVLIFFIMGLFNALSGETKPLPLIGEYGEKLKI